MRLDHGNENNEKKKPTTCKDTHVSWVTEEKKKVKLKKYT